MNSIKQTFVSGTDDVPSNVQGVGDSAELRQLSSTVPSMEPCLTPSIQPEGPTTGRDSLKRKTSDDDDVFGSSRAILPNTAWTSRPPRAKRSRNGPNPGPNSNVNPSVQASDGATNNNFNPHLGNRNQTSASVAPIITQRAARLAKVSGEAGSNNLPKGQVRKAVGGSLEYFENETGAWVPAVYHNDIRGQLIQEASRQGKYDHQRKQGEGANDVTSFLPSQKSWGKERKAWPEILFQIKADLDQTLPRDMPVWKRKGQVILDHDNRPVRLSSTLPDTCSSEMEGWLMVAIYHSDHRIQLTDIRARMPKVMVKKGKSVPLFGLNNISMRMTRFRKEAAIGPRTERAGSTALKAVYQKFLPKQCIAENSTKALKEPLTSGQKRKLKDINKGKFPQKGRAETRLQGGGNPETSKKRKREGTKGPSDDQTNDTEGKPVKSARIELQTPDLATHTGHNSVAAAPASLSSGGSLNPAVSGTYPSEYAPKETPVGYSAPEYQMDQLSTVGDGANLNGDDQPNPFSVSAEFRGYHRQDIEPRQNEIRECGEEWREVNFGHYGQTDPRQDFSREPHVAGRDRPSAVRFGTEHDIIGNPLARDHELPWTGLIGSTETQDGYLQAVPEYSNFEQLRRERAEPTETCGRGFQAVSDHGSAEEQEVDELSAPQTFYPDPEEISYGPYGPLPKGYPFA